MLHHDAILYSTKVVVVVAKICLSREETSVTCSSAQSVKFLFFGQHVFFDLEFILGASDKLFF